MSELEPAQEALLTFYEWLQEMPIDEAELAVKGIQAYNEDIQREREIELGWHRLSRDTDTDSG